ncbi:iron ABC transporter permease [Mangrovivirga cuniculi]|uniref:Iron ABC transporter n=1 Tax=Mangrovivirga cuniculi TaxID=2715131 RepID=A0A4D7K3H2_9BACT|nr:iron ABC transporter permease [Mangrovivirga cuniculi]QCK13968.1 iron ABC transporter [Mangrovivirga cuniculi]
MSKTTILIFLVIILFAGFILSLCLGSVLLSPSQIIDALFSGKSSIYSDIIIEYRLPKAITAVIAGMALSISGLLMQNFFRNPLAGPFVLGVSSGAGLFVAILIMTGWYAGLSLGSIDIHQSTMVSFAAIIGAMAVLLLLLLIQSINKDYTTLLIVGLMISSAVSAVISLIQYFSQSQDIQRYLLWTMGSLGALSWWEISGLVIALLVCVTVLIVIIKPLNALNLGESYALSMGVKVQTVRILILLTSGVLAGMITAYCGPIGFIGLAVPHLSRQFLKTFHPAWLIPGTAITGGAILLFCDIIAQVPGMDFVLPINTVTALFGAPWVIIYLLRKKLSGTFN